MIRRSDASASSGVLRNRTRCDAAPVTDESRKHRYERPSVSRVAMRCRHVALIKHPRAAAAAKLRRRRDDLG